MQDGQSGANNHQRPGVLRAIGRVRGKTIGKAGVAGRPRARWNAFETPAGAGNPNYGNSTSYGGCDGFDGVYGTLAEVLART